VKQNEDEDELDKGHCFKLKEIKIEQNKTMTNHLNKKYKFGI
jgi:hypothetical protein